MQVSHVRSEPSKNLASETFDVEDSEKDVLCVYLEGALLAGEPGGPFESPLCPGCERKFGDRR
jgi:hypothetical protein